MKIDIRARNDMRYVASDAREAEELQCDGVWNSETDSDPFPGLTLMAEHTSSIGIGPSIAVAFARTPMPMAYTAYQLQGFSGGRFTLGIGSQIKPHIERRHSMPWSQPAARMKEYILALRAIWNSWDSGDALKFQGEFYTHTLMPPAFRPPKHEFGNPKIYMAAVGPHMLGVAGEVSDGIFPHLFNTGAYLRQVVVPAVREGQARAGRPESDVEIVASTFVAFDERDYEAVRQNISFYGSTPAYRPVLEMHGWGDLQDELNRLSKENRWQEMVPLVTDDIVNEMCAHGSPSQIASTIKQRFSGLADRIGFSVPGETPPPSRFSEVIDALRS